MTGRSVLVSYPEMKLEPKKRNVHLTVVLLLLAIFFSRCTNKMDMPDLTDYVSFCHEQQIVRLNDSTSVALKIEGVFDSTYVYRWSADNGNIVGSGYKAEYYAPGLGDSAIIYVDVSKHGRPANSYSTKIILYRQFIMLKADDFGYDKVNVVSDNWRLFIDLIKLKKIKASLGLIGRALTEGNDQYFSYVKNLNASGDFEIWNHGYSHLLTGRDSTGHIYHEFWNTSYGIQRGSLLRTQNLAREKLNITLKVFGAPGNNIDQNTLKALNENRDIKVWYFGMDDYLNLDLRRLAEIEFPTFFPDFQQFQLHYSSEPSYLVLQIHPNAWDSKGFSEFEKIIDFLIQNNVTFINPSAYYEFLRNK
jgi:hypothetical protein